MGHPRSILLVGGISMLVAVASVEARVRISHDPIVNFASYKTYSWSTIQRTDYSRNDQIQHYVAAQLAIKGWTEVESNSDAVVSAFVCTREEQTHQTFNIAGTGVIATVTATTHIGNAIVEIFDARSHKLIWQGEDSADFSSNAGGNGEKLHKDIDKMFKNFPGV